MFSRYGLFQNYAKSISALLRICKDWRLFDWRLERIKTVQIVIVNKGRKSVEELLRRLKSSPVLALTYPSSQYIMNTVAFNPRLNKFCCSN